MSTQVKGYVVAQIEIHDHELYSRDYIPHVAAVLAEFDGKYLVRGGSPQTLEGEDAPSRVIIMEFPSPEQAQAFWNSPKFRQLSEVRRQATISRIFLVEGAG
jgi:uncharacterized protein (DUF1330 family)